MNSDEQIKNKNRNSNLNHKPTGLRALLNVTSVISVVILFLNTNKTWTRPISSSSSALHRLYIQQAADDKKKTKTGFLSNI